MNRVTLLRRLLPLAGLIALALLPATASATPTGLNVSSVPLSEQGWQDLIASHARTARIWVFTDYLESAPGTLRPEILSTYDDFVDRARANGIQVLFTIMRAPGATVPPPAGDYARIAGELAAHFRGRALGYEVWNEPDDPPFWAGAPDPGAYAALLEPAHTAIKAADPSAEVVVGGLVGNDLDFVNGLYAAGAKGSFDAVAVHTDTACNTTDPTEYYREPTGRIGRYSFTGYREIHKAMVEHGDSGEIWMTELGWASMTSTCTSGDRAGTKPGGVTQAQQATFLTKAYECLAGDPYVKQAMWFNNQDFDSSSTSYAERLGLVTDAEARKPAFSAFAHANGVSAINCGGALDSSTPTVLIVTPSDGTMYSSSVPVHIHAEDSQGIQDVNLTLDGRNIPFTTPKGRTSDITLNLHQAGSVGYGPHRLVATARDEARNVGRATATIIRVGGGGYNQRIPSALRVRFGTVSKRRMAVSGRVTFANGVRGDGEVQFRFDRKVKGRWITRNFRFRTAHRAFRFTFAFKNPGRWRVRTRYAPKGPFASATVATRLLRIR